MHNEKESLNINSAVVIENIIEKEDIGHKECPHCREKKCIKFGKFKGIQRYRCKSCKKTFSDITNTPFCRSKKSRDCWVSYFKLMFQGMSIRACAAKLKINIATAFYWRHKILDSLFLLEGKEVLTGDIQLRDVYFQVSFKGQKGKRMAKRPNPFIRRVKIEECISVLCAMDSNGKVIADPLCKSIFRPYGVKDWLDKRIELAPKAKFISSVMRFNNKLSVTIFQNRIKKGSEEETRSGRDLGTKLELWIGKNFKGVATKYLNNYLVWFKYFMADSFKSYKEFFSKELNILIKAKENIFWVRRNKDYKDKKILLYGDKRVHFKEGWI